MSDLIKLIKVKQPHYMGGDNRFTEKLAELEEKCESCQGSGWFWGENEHGESVKKDCPCCEGSGKMQATVKIYWEPGKK